MDGLAKRGPTIPGQYPHHQEIWQGGVGVAKMPEICSFLRMLQKYGHISPGSPRLGHQNTLYWVSDFKKKPV